jgi:hypothetical protein
VLKILLAQVDTGGHSKDKMPRHKISRKRQVGIQKNISKMLGRVFHFVGQTHFGFFNLLGRSFSIGHLQMPGHTELGNEGGHNFEAREYLK